MPSKRLRSKNVYFMLNAVDYSDEIVDIELNVAPDEPVTLGGPEGKYSLQGTAIASVKSASFQRYLRTNANDTGVAFVLGFDGATPSADNPHYTGTVTLPLEPSLKAGPYGETSTFTFNIECDDKPTEDIAP
jgi:hypothetical protein